VTGLEFANVVGMITYQQELDLAAHAEMFDERDEITYVTYEPAENHRADYILAGGKYP
jgi:transcription initiation factor TFIID TATA-box-binding protein